MKQTKLFLVALMCMMMQTVVCNADDDVMIPVSQLPAAARTFVQKTFPGKKILYAQKDHFFSSKYDVRLDDGTEVDFERNGMWDKVDCHYTVVPASLIPAAIANYVKANFPESIVTKIDKERHGYDVELSNELELKFNKRGMLIGMDD